MSTFKKVFIPAIIIVIIIAGIFFIKYNNKPLVLMYHNLCENEADINSQTVTAEKFKADMLYLKEHGYTTVLPRELVSDGFKMPRKAVIISFDDGYRSNYLLAYPILKELGLKAEISVITSMTDTAEEVFVNYCTWDMLKEMSDSGIIEIGSHTDNLHNPDNGGLLYDSEANGVQRGEASDALRDLEKSYDKIFAYTGIKPSCFAYPYGAIRGEIKADIDRLFPVNFSTEPRKINTSREYTFMARFRVDQDTDLTKILQLI